MKNFLISRKHLVVGLALWLGLAFQLEAQFFPGGFGGGGGFGTGGRSRNSSSRSYPGNSEVGDAVISIDPETRSLIVIADEKTRTYISQVVSNLDRPKPQVLIKVVFLEVTHGNGLDLGLEGSFRTTTGDGWNTGGVSTNYSVGSSNNLISSLVPTRAFTSFTGTNISGIPGLANGGTGLYQIFGENYLVTLHAMATAGNAKILSRPSIIARNNQPATILVGQTVPLVTSVRYDSLGNAINGINYTDVGIILRVTPFITSDGLVEMILAPEISSVSATDSTVISSGPGGINPVTAPFIDKRSADTVVVTPDGQTVIIGGLIRNSKSYAESKIPYLGDIPLLGNLFKRRVTTEGKTELLIFLTPQIMYSPTELAAVSERERARSEGSKSFSDKELNKFLDSLPTKAPAESTKTPGS